MSSLELSGDVLFNSCTLCTLYYDEVRKKYDPRKEHCCVLRTLRESSRRSACISECVGVCRFTWVPRRKPTPSAFLGCHYSRREPPWWTTASPAYKRTRAIYDTTRIQRLSSRPRPIGILLFHWTPFTRYFPYFVICPSIHFTPLCSLPTNRWLRVLLRPFISLCFFVTVLHFDHE